MVDESEQPKKGFHFLPRYADLIAEATNRWAYIEYYINGSIWALAGVPPAVGACMTSQMYTANAKLSALLSLMKLRKVDQGLIDKVNKFSSSFRDALEARNRIAHDMWLNANFQPDKMGKMRMTADKKLNFKIEVISEDQLRADVEIIEVRRAEFGGIREQILAVAASLPDMSHAELHPITETPKSP